MTSHHTTTSDTYENKVGEQVAYESWHNSNTDEMMREVNSYRANHTAAQTQKVVDSANKYLEKYNFPTITTVSENGKISGFDVGDYHYGTSYKDKTSIDSPSEQKKTLTKTLSDGEKVETKGDNVLTTTGKKSETIDNKDYDKATWCNATKNVTVTDNDGKLHVQRYGDSGLLWASNNYSIDIDKQTGKVTGEYTDSFGGHNKMNFDNFSDYIKDMQNNSHTDELQLLYKSGKLSSGLQSQLKQALGY